MFSIKHLERNWVFLEPVTVSPNLLNILPNADLVLKTLVRRGLSSPAEVLTFIDHTRYTPTPAYELPDMEKGVQRIYSAIQNNEMIGVWGDFDVDGQTSTAILISTLRELDAEVIFHIPVRGPETHGIGLQALQDFLAQGVKVILTCDTGITAHEAIDYAQSQEIDVVVTDHHLLPETLPNACALINPRRLPTVHPLSSLPGAGTAYKFAEALLGRFGKQELASQLHDLAALGIIADLADLRGDARFLVQSGISRLRTSPRPALAAMLESAEIDPSNLTEEQISFTIAPRLNAVGRLSDANPMVDFLLSHDASEIAVRVNQVEGLNNKRKLLCDQVFFGAQSQIEQDHLLLDHPVLVLHHLDWPAGVVGIVASRLVEIYHRPAILLTGPPGEPLRGSARSVEGVDITAALRRNAHLLRGYGGHPMAAGLSLSEENLPGLKRGLDAAVSEALATRGEAGTLFIDQTISPSEITLDLVRSLDLLAPYGPGNPSLVFCADGLQVVNSRAIGKLKEHLLVDVEDMKGNANRFIWWNGSGLPVPEGRFDLAYTARASNYRGEEQVSLEWIDYRMVNADIDISKSKSELPWMNVDLRNSESRLRDVQEFLDTVETLVWAEGSALPSFTSFNRLKLHPCRNLVLWSVPPSMATLKTILDQAKPEQVIWCLVSPPEHQTRQFLVRIASLVKKTLSEGQSELDLSTLASAAAAAESTVDIALRWLSARGDITITGRHQAIVSVSLGGIPDPDEQKRLEKALVNVFDEVKAFSSYLRHVNLDQLITNLR
jgi:single-stranded-DNA-specific exonuclease